MAESPPSHRQQYLPLALDYPALVAEYPPAGDYEQTVWRWSREEIDALQERRFRDVVAAAWTFPFYQRLWGGAGLAPGDIRGRADLASLPTFDVHDLRADLDAHPPFGTHQRGPGDGSELMRIITSGGTTGTPRPLMISARDREISAIVGSRSLHLHGIRPGMLVQVVNSLSTVLGGIYLLECLSKYNGAVPLTTGGGNSTGTGLQVQMAHGYGTQAIAGFPDYIRHIGHQAVEAGLDPRTDLAVRVISSPLGTRDRRPLEELFGARVYDMYGTSEVGGFVSTECPARTGLHVMEDVHLLEVLEKDTDRPVGGGELGNGVVTCLFKRSAPIIRYNTHDLVRWLEPGCPCGSVLARHGPVEGRTDDLIKVKGTWLHPGVVGQVIDREPRSSGEYVCLLDPDAPEDGRDPLRVLVEVADDAVDRVALAEHLAAELKREVGLRLPVECVDRDALDPLTGRSTSRTGKPTRLVVQASAAPEGEP